MIEREHIGKRVRAYRNLRTGGYSLQYRGRVIAHPTELVLMNARFIVQPGGRKRAQEEGVRNVHAFADGVLTAVEFLPEAMRSVSVRYNPFTTEGFVDERGLLVAQALYIHLHPEFVKAYAPVYAAA